RFMRHVVLALAFFSAVSISSRALAAPCPTVMVVLDISGSMDLTPDNNFGSPSKLDLAKMAITTLMMKYGDRIPFGLTTFSADVCQMGTGVNILVEPAHDTKAKIVAAAAAAATVSGTNTMSAIQTVAADPAMHDPMRPASYMLLITDGEPT